MRNVKKTSPSHEQSFWHVAHREFTIPTYCCEGSSQKLSEVANTTVSIVWEETETGCQTVGLRESYSQRDW